MYEKLLNIQCTIRYCNYIPCSSSTIFPSKWYKCLQMDSTTVLVIRFVMDLLRASLPLKR